MSRLLWVVFAAAGATLAVLGLEIVAALRRGYLPSSPALEIAGSFGPEDGKPLRFAVLGDSTAAGVGAGSVERSYPALLAARLGDAGCRVELLGFGVSGARMADLPSKQAPRAVAAHPDLVLVALGGNDATHLTPLSALRRDLGAGLDLLEEAGAPVVVTGAPDMRARAFLEPLRTFMGWRGRRVSRAIRQVVQERKLTFVPLAERTARFFGEDPDSTFSEDLFHPGPEGYARWADAIYPGLEEALARR